jgi:hypothetical protein
MPHHKRRRPRNRRAGCLLCKPWKVNGFATKRRDGERFSITAAARRPMLSVGWASSDPRTPPNPQMQPAGRGGPELRAGATLHVAKRRKRWFV